MTFQKQGLIYINNYNRLDDRPAVEKILVDSIPPETTHQVSDIWENLESQIEKTTNLEKVGSKISKVLHRSLPFKGFNSAFEFFKEIDGSNILSFSNRYLLNSFQDNPKLLSQLIIQCDLNCVGQAIIMNSVSDENWELYNQTYTNEKGDILKDAHCIIAKRIKDQYLIIDPSNGPLKERRKRKVYTYSIQEFMNTYKKATFIKPN